VPQDAELSRHDPDVKPWDECSAEEQKLYARMMEVYAGFLTHTDHHIGRVLDFLKQIGEFDNTLVMVLSDNGASSEGGPEGSVNENLFFNFVPESLEENLAAIDELGGPKHFNHYPWGWTWAGNTPFRRWKRETYRGGTSDPFIVHWPDGIKAKGEVRTQYAHAIDMVPTVLEAVGITPPNSVKGVTQSPIEGVSLAETFENAAAPNRHHVQYFEMLGHRAIYHDGWRAVCPWPGPSFAESGHPFGTPIPAQTLTEMDANNWELYYVDEDFAENHNLAEVNLANVVGGLSLWLQGKGNSADAVRAKLIEMVGQWYVEAGKYNVLPVDGRGQQRFADERPKIAEARTSYTFYPGTQEVPINAAANIMNRAYSITVDVEFAEGDQGVLISQGGIDGGYTFFVKDGKLHHLYNYVARTYFHVESESAVPAGRRQLRYEFEPTGEPDVLAGKGAPGRAQLYIDDKLVGQTQMTVTNPIMLGLASGVAVGADPGAPVSMDAYKGPFPFTGTIHTVTIDVSGDLIVDEEAVMRMVMARQ
jgi:arylsulfatase